MAEPFKAPPISSWEGPADPTAQFKAPPISSWEGPAIVTASDEANRALAGTGLSVSQPTGAIPSALQPMAGPTNPGFGTGTRNPRTGRAYTDRQQTSTPPLNPPQAPSSTSSITAYNPTYVERAGEIFKSGAMGRALGLSSETEAAKQRQGGDNPMLRFEAALPDQPGVLRGAAQTASSLTTPENVLIAAGTGGFGAIDSAMGKVALSKLLKYGFSASMVNNAAQRVPGFVDAVKKGDWDQARELATKGLLELGLATHSAVSGKLTETTPEGQMGGKTVIPMPGEMVDQTLARGKQAVTATGQAVATGAKAATGAVGQGASALAKTFESSPKALAAQAWKPNASDNILLDRIEPTVAGIQEHGGVPEIKTNEDAIKATKNRIHYLQDTALESYMEEGRKRNALVPLASLGEGVREAIPILDELEDQKGVADLKKKMEDTYGKTTMTVDRAREFLKQLNAMRDKFYDKSTGSRNAVTIASATEEARLGVLRDKLAEALYQTLDPNGVDAAGNPDPGAGPRKIQMQTRDAMNLLDHANQSRNAIAREQPINRADALANTLFSIADLPGKAVHGNLEGGVSNVLRMGGSESDAKIKRLFKSVDRSKLEPTPMAGKSGPPPPEAPPPSPTETPGSTPPPGASPNTPPAAPPTGTAPPGTPPPTTAAGGPLPGQPTAWPPPSSLALPSPALGQPTTPGGPRFIPAGAPPEIVARANQIFTERNAIAQDWAGVPFQKLKPQERVLVMQEQENPGGPRPSWAKPVQPSQEPGTPPPPAPRALRPSPPAEIGDIPPAGVREAAVQRNAQKKSPAAAEAPVVAPEPERTVQNMVKREDTMKPEVAATLKEGSTRVNSQGGVEMLQKVPLDQIDAAPGTERSPLGNKMDAEKVADMMENPPATQPELRTKEDGRFRAYDGHHRIAAMKADEMGLKPEDVRKMSSEQIQDLWKSAQTGKKDTLAWTSEPNESDFPKVPTPADARAAGELAANPPEPAKAGEEGGGPLTSSPRRDAAPAAESAPPAKTADWKAASTQGHFFPNTPEEVPPPTVTTKMDLADLQRDPGRFQFKREAIGQGGVDDRFKGVEFDPAVAGPIHVWRDPADGKVYVVNGHHRFDMATRSGAPEMEVKFLDAANAQEARSQGAILNLKANQGSAIDAATIFRDMGGVTAEDFKKWGLSPKIKIVSQGAEIAKLTPGLFRMVVDGDMTEERGALIGRELGNDPAQQDALVGMIRKKQASGKDFSDKAVENMIGLGKGGETVAGNQGGLFPEDEQGQAALEQTANFVERIRAKLSGDRRLFSMASKSSNVEKLGKAGNVLEADKNKAIAKDAAQVQAVYDKLKFNSGPINDLLRQAGKEIADGAKPKDIEDAYYGRIQQAVADELGGGPKPQGPGPAGNPSAAEGRGTNGSVRSGQASDIQAQLGKGTPPPPSGDLFGDETSKISEAQAAAEAKGKAQLSGDQLTAEFNSPVNATNRRTKLKSGAKPVQEDLFGPGTPPPPQTGFDFQKDIANKGIKNDFGKKLDMKDVSGSIENMAVRSFKASADGKVPARIYIDDTGAAVLGEVYSAIKKHSPYDVNDIKYDVSGLAMTEANAQKVIQKLRSNVSQATASGKSALSDAARARMGDLADAIEKATKDNPDGAIIVKGSTGLGIAKIRDTIRHESAHLQQYGVETGETGTRPLVNYATAEKKIPFYKQAAKALGEQGYNSKNVDTMVKEILSVSAERTYDPETGKNRIGLTQDQMRQAVKGILDEAVAIHGAKAYDLNYHASKEFRKAVVTGARIRGPRKPS